MIIPTVIETMEYAMPNMELGFNSTDRISRFSDDSVRSISIPLVRGKKRAIAPSIGGNSSIGTNIPEIKRSMYVTIAEIDDVLEFMRVSPASISPKPYNPAKVTKQVANIGRVIANGEMPIANDSPKNIMITIPLERISDERALKDNTITGPYGLRKIFSMVPKYFSSRI
jgi:hypothetical protein